MFCFNALLPECKLLDVIVINTKQQWGKDAELNFTSLRS